MVEEHKQQKQQTQAFSRPYFDPTSIIEAMMNDLEIKINNLIEDFSGKTLETKENGEKVWVQLHNHPILEKTEDMMSLRAFLESVVNPTTVFSNYNEKQISSLTEINNEILIYWGYGRDYLPISVKDYIINQCMNLIMSTLNRAKNGRERSEVWGAIKVLETKQSFDENEKPKGLKGLFTGGK